MISYEGQTDLDPLIVALNKAHGHTSSGDLEQDLQHHIVLGNFAVVQVEALDLQSTEARRILQPA